MRRVTRCAAVLLAAIAVAPLGCKEEPGKSGETPGEKAGKAVEHAVDATTQKVVEAKDATAKAATDVKDAVVAGVAPSGINDLKGIHSTLEGIVQNAVKRNEWASLVGNFTKADADRVTAGKPDSKDLDDLGDQFADAWSKTFNDKFTVMDADKVFGPEFVKLSTTSSGSDKNPTATGTIGASHGAPTLDLTFAGEGGKWRLDIPDTVDAQTLHDNLKMALTDLQDTSKWPSDKMEACRAASHHLLAAVMNKH